jgi:hypothetical protein
MISVAQVKHTLFSIMQISSDNTLIITNIQREDAGPYKCSAANFVGRITSVATIKVNGKLTVYKESVLTSAKELQ